MEYVLNSELPVLVDFWAPWCPPCIQPGPTIEEIAADYKGKAVVCKIDVDQAGDIAQKQEISSIPALLFFKNGKVEGTFTGFKPRKEIVEKLETLF